MPLDIDLINREYINKIDANTMQFIESHPYVMRKLCFSKKTGYGKILSYTLSENFLQ